MVITKDNRMTTYTEPLMTMRKIFMALGSVLFVLLMAHSIATAGTPKAAHYSHDVQPEVHQQVLAIHKL